MVWRCGNGRPTPDVRASQGAADDEEACRDPVVHGGCDGAHDPVDGAEIAKHLEAGEFFWLDLHKPTGGDLACLETCSSSTRWPSKTWSIRPAPKFDSFDEFAYLVVYGANEDKDGLVEVHCFFSGRTSSPSTAKLPAVRGAARRATARPAAGPGRQAPVHGRRRAGRQLRPQPQPSSTTVSTTSRTASCRRPDDEQLQELLPAQAPARRVAKGDQPRARHLRAHRHRRHRDPGYDAGHGAVLPRRLRPPHPHQRPHRQLP